MAYLCPGCSAVHPEGSVNCEHATELINKQSEEMRIRIIAHRENCDCPDAAEHLRKRDREKQKGRGLWDNRPFGTSV